MFHEEKDWKEKPNEKICIWKNERKMYEKRLEKT